MDLGEGGDDDFGIQIDDGPERPGRGESGRGRGRGRGGKPTVRIKVSSSGITCWSEKKRAEVIATPTC